MNNTKTLRFDDQVVIITGAGRGIGKEYALEFGRRGARVLVNDVGGSQYGIGTDTEPANSVVREIISNNGIAIADYNSVENADKIIEHALNEFGRIDILINNATIIRDGSFLKMEADDWDKVYQVNLLGSFRMSKAVWPIMREQRYGRIINTTSASGLYGNFGQANYASMKMGIIGLSNVLYKEGLKYNIHVNTVSPVAGTRLTESVFPDDVMETLKPEYNAPMVLYLCHQSCNETGGIFEMGGGWIGKIRFERSQGTCFPLQKDQLTIEQVAEQWDEVVDFGRISHPTSTQESFDPIIKNVNSPPKQVKRPQSLMRSYAIFQRLKIAMEETGKNLVDEIGGVIQWIIISPKSQKESCWTIDLSQGNGNLIEGTTNAKPEVIFYISEDNFLALSSGKLPVQKALAHGKMRLKGNMTYARKLTPLLKILQQHAKL